MQCSIHCLICFQITPIVVSPSDGDKYPGHDVELTLITANWTDPTGETTGNNICFSFRHSLIFLLLLTTFYEFTLFSKTNVCIGVRGGGGGAQSFKWPFSGKIQIIFGQNHLIFGQML